MALRTRRLSSLTYKQLRDKQLRASLRLYSLHHRIHLEVNDMASSSHLRNLHDVKLCSGRINRLSNEVIKTVEMIGNIGQELGAKL